MKKGLNLHRTSNKFNRLERFLLYCAGSDLDLLSNCRRAEQIKHIGFGSLVLVPAVLAFVSMSYALSTLNGIHDHLWLAILGGSIWSLIIFAFDRFIVSTHRRKRKDIEELKRPAFYLRFIFALILGIVISHPLVMLYFNGSIADQMKTNIETGKALISSQYESKLVSKEEALARLDSLYWNKMMKRDQQAELVAKEIDGEVIKNAKGEIETTGIIGKGPSAKNKIAQLTRLDNELKQLAEENKRKEKEIVESRERLEAKRDSSMAAFDLSADYLHQEKALEQLKEKNPIVGTTQWMIITLFVLIDLLPFIFKTFSTYGLYDRVLGEEEEDLKQIDLKDRSLFWQEKFERANQF